MGTIPFKRQSYTNRIVVGETVDRLLLLSDLCDNAFGNHVGQWVRLLIRVHRGKPIPPHIAGALADIEEAALERLNV